MQEDRIPTYMYCIEGIVGAQLGNEREPCPKVPRDTSEAQLELRMEHILNSGPTWIWAVAILFAAILFALAVDAILFFILNRLARRNGNVFIHSLVGHGQLPFRFILPLLALMAVLPAVRLSDEVLTPIERVIGLGLIAATAWVVILATQVISDLISAQYRIDLVDNLSA